jgi:hypothetical protein
MKGSPYIREMIHSNLSEPNIWDQISGAINNSNLKTTVEISPDAKNILYTVAGTLSAALILAAIINRSR